MYAFIFIEAMYHYYINIRESEKQENYLRGCFDFLRKHKGGLIFFNARRCLAF